MKFKIGDRIVDPESYRNTGEHKRTGTIQNPSRDNYPCDIRWDDGYTFSYKESELERMILANKEKEVNNE